MNTARDLGERIRTVRKCRKMFQQDLAILCGFTRQYLSAIESGRTTPTISQLCKIAEHLECKAIVTIVMNEVIDVQEGKV